MIVVLSCCSNEVKKAGTGNGQYWEYKGWEALTGNLFRKNKVAK